MNEHQQKALRKMDAEQRNTTALDFSGCGFIRVPQKVFKLTKLEKLDLSGNQLREIPVAIGN